MAKFKIVENKYGKFNVMMKKYWFFPWTYLSDPKYSQLRWQSGTKRGAQAYINLKSSVRKQKN
tara:strand:+ start:599 stop:787 length:189 start_codon:yes stop_codon:yes gene_type:complete